LLLLFILVPLTDTPAVDAQRDYEHARRLFIRGDLKDSQLEAELGYKRFRTYNRKWASDFLLLKAESMLQRGMYDGALQTLTSRDFNFDSPDPLIRSLTIESISLLRQQQPDPAKQKLAQASNLCKAATSPSCGEVLQARGIFAVSNGAIEKAQELFLAAHAFAAAHHDGYLDASAALNLGWAALQVDHLEEAIYWLTAAARLSDEIGAEDLKEKCSGNLGWTYYQLGDDERALKHFSAAEQTAAHAGNLRFDLKWISTEGYLYRDSGDLPRAMESYRRAFLLAEQLDSKEDIENALEDLAQLAVVSGKLKDAGEYIHQVAPMQYANDAKLSPNLMLTMGQLAAAQHHDAEAEADYRSVWNDGGSLTTLRLDAGAGLATLYESEKRSGAAERTYKSTLAAYESARATLRQEETQLPFGANATQIYDDYIHLLVSEGRMNEALATADLSRARTLEQGSDSDREKTSFHPGVIAPRRIAQHFHATLLFYWLGERQSYLWAVTEARVSLFILPPQQQIAARVQSYRNAILNLQDPLRVGNKDGQWLYSTLVAPAAALIRSGKPVIVLDDGTLSELNFETLLAPGPGSTKESEPGATTHYLIEDFTLVSAPSLAMFASRRDNLDSGAKMLLLGDPVAASQEFPTLPLFGYELKKIESHFSKSRLTVFAGRQATPAAYLASHPSQYSYIHFVSHAIANRNDPLESAVVLSPSNANENSFKLYARDIIKAHIDAQLVTISACSGSGTRLYAGEGLVGLTWAFLRAGAQRVIGALWEVSDISTPRLMDSFYGHLAAGESPEASLRMAKLELIRSRNRFRLPFYWAPFQMYDRD
jgi:CHAT domain-containing protein